MKVVLDTNVVIAALRSPRGAAAEVVRRVLNLELDAAITTALVLEYEAVACRSEHLTASGLSAEATIAVIDALAAVGEQTPIRCRLRPASPDPNDDFVLEAAWNAGASVLVTENQKDLGAAAATFGIRTLSPSMLLLELRGPK